MGPKPNEQLPEGQESAPLLREKFLGDIDEGASGPQITPEPSTPQRALISRRISGVFGAALVLVVILGFLSVILLQTQSAATRLSAGGQQNQRSSPAVDITDTATAEGTATPPPTATTSGAGDEATPTPFPPYNGPPMVLVALLSSSCTAGSPSPYPMISVGNQSRDTFLHWRIALSSSAFRPVNLDGGALPNPIVPLAYPGMKVAFEGPSSTTAPLTIWLTTNLGSWSDTFQPCAVATPTPIPPPPTATPYILPLTFPCAEQTATGWKVCIHTDPYAGVQVDSVYNACAGAVEPPNGTLVYFGWTVDQNGDTTLEWTPSVSCRGSVTLTMNAWDGQHHTAKASVTFVLH